MPKETVEATLEDVGQLLDFVLLEFQRILFAENVSQTVAVSITIFIPASHLIRIGLLRSFHLVLAG